MGLIEDRDHWEWLVLSVRENTGLQNVVNIVVMSDYKKGLYSALYDECKAISEGDAEFLLARVLGICMLIG